jgi:transcriptional regulator with XRE-family HTH domain
MDEKTSLLSQAIGARVRTERTARGWTLDELSQASGVSRRMIVTVEQGSVNPSVGILLRISDALGVGLPALVDAPTLTPVTVTRNGKGAELWHSPAGGRGVLVARTTPPDVVELWDWTLAPGDTHNSEAHSPGTQELLHVLSGRPTLTVGDESVTLTDGDAVSFAADAAHSYANPDSIPTRFSLAVFEPGVGTVARSENLP